MNIIYTFLPSVLLKCVLAIINLHNKYTIVYVHNNNTAMFPEKKGFMKHDFVNVILPPPFVTVLLNCVFSTHRIFLHLHIPQIVLRGIKVKLKYLF